MCLATMLCLPACADRDERLAQHRKALQSLASTTRAVSAGWLAGHLSGTFTETALDQTLHLVEQERATVASTPDTLIDPRGADLAAEADRLERILAQMIGAVRTADGAAVREHMASIASNAGSHRP